MSEVPKKKVESMKYEAVKAIRRRGRWRRGGYVGVFFCAGG